MKQHIFMIVMSIAAIGAKAQNIFGEKISFATTVGTGISASTPSPTPFTWQITGYYSLSDRWSVGAGTGLFFYEKMLVPIYGDVRFQIGRERKFTPFVEFATGYSFAPADDACGGVFVNPSIGIRYPLKNKMALQLSAGYEWLDLKRLKKQTDNYFHKEFEERLRSQIISLKIGLRF
jgi:hypothetical protein